MIVKCYKCKADTGEFAPLNTTMVKLCSKCREEEDEYIRDSFVPKEGQPCGNCKTRPGTVQWVGDGGVMGLIHGMYDFWCEICCTEAQLKNARDSAARIPELEKKLKELTMGPEIPGTTQISPGLYVAKESTSIFASEAERLPNLNKYQESLLPALQEALADWLPEDDIDPDSVTFSPEDIAALCNEEEE